MIHLKRNYSDKAGKPPGTIVYVGIEKTEEIFMSEMNFSVDSYEDNKLKDISDSKAWDSDAITTWVSVGGIHKTETVESIGKFFHLDNLILEDIVNSHHRPKFEGHDENYLFIVLKALSIDEQRNEVISEQLSLVASNNWVISFTEGDFHLFDPIRKRIRLAKGIIRQRKSNYIFYRLIDIIVDDYYLATEFISEQLDELEDRILNNRDERVDEEIYKLKKQIGSIKKAIVPLREVISNIIRSESLLIDDNIKNHFRDVHEHIIHVIEDNDTHRESINDFLNLYMSGMSNKMNQVMKVLTIFASIFIPLTFIAGIYGMNFENMPELGWEYGYHFVWVIMIATVIGLLFYFKRKKWL